MRPERGSGGPDGVGVGASQGVDAFKRVPPFRQGTGADNSISITQRPLKSNGEDTDGFYHKRRVDLILADWSSSSY